MLHRFNRDVQYLFIALAVLAGIALLSTAAFACLLLAFIKQRKGSSKTSKYPVETYYPSAIIGDTVKITDDSRLVFQKQVLMLYTSLTESIRGEFSKEILFCSFFL